MRAAVSVPSAYLKQSPADQKKKPELSCVEDEVFLGMELEVTGEERDGQIPVLTEYGYSGWIRSDQVIPEKERKDAGKNRAGGGDDENNGSRGVPDGENRERGTLQDGRVRIVWSKNFTDVLVSPSVKAAPVMRDLPRGARVRIAVENTEEYPAENPAGNTEENPAGNPAGNTKENTAENPKISASSGWQRVILPDGREGYVPARILGPYYPKPLILPDGTLTESGRKAGWLGGAMKERGGGENDPIACFQAEMMFRRRLADTARMYLGSPYRWGCKTPAGLDCSGLCSVAYLLNGIRIFRDASIEPGFPIHAIDPERMKEGDLLYFPGHIAMYLGGGEYIHSTAAAGSDGVTINSLRPSSPLYRPDLPGEIIAVGSYFES